MSRQREKGLAAVKRILEELISDSTWRFDGYELKEAKDKLTHQLVIWRGDNYTEPIRLPNLQLDETATSPQARKWIKMFLKKEIWRQLKSIYRIEE